MRMEHECVPCFLRQAINASRFAGLERDLEEKMLREVLRVLHTSSWEATPPSMAHKVHSIVRRWVKGDPYAQVKRKSNMEALEILPEMRKRVEESGDRLLTALKLSAAANVVDFGAKESYDLRKALEEALKKEFYVNHYTRLRKDLERAENILFFADNSGEIVFDRLLLEVILDNYQVKAISFVVKGGPILNDATIEDAVLSGVDSLPGVSFLRIGNGEEGTGPERDSEEVKGWINSHDLTISKGQGNFEGLSEFRGVYHLLTVKCPPVSRYVGVPVDERVLLYM